MIVGDVIDIEHRLIACEQSVDLRRRHRRVPHGKMGDLAEEVAARVPDDRRSISYPSAGFSSATEPDRARRIGGSTASSLVLVSTGLVHADANVRIRGLEHAVDVDIVTLSSVRACRDQVLMPESVVSASKRESVGGAATHLATARRGLIAVRVADVVRVGYVGHSICSEQVEPDGVAVMWVVQGLGRTRWADGQWCRVRAHSGRCRSRL